jgi:hypothetical protein
MDMVRSRADPERAGKFYPGTQRITIDREGSVGVRIADGSKIR